MSEIFTGRKNDHKDILTTTIPLIMIMIYGIAVFVFIITPILAFSWTNKPFPGFMVEQTAVLTNQSGGGWDNIRLGLTHPQKVTQIGDRAILNSSDFQEALEVYSPGEIIKIQTINPDGTRNPSTSVALITFPKRDLLKLFGIPYLTGIAYILLGLWVFVRRWYTRPGRAFAYFCAWAAITNGLYFDLISTHVWPTVWTVAISQIGGALIYLAMFFPEEIPWIQNHPQILLLPIAVPLGVSLWGLLVLNSYNDPWAYIYAWRASYTLAAIGIVFFLGMMVYRLRASSKTIIQQQVRITLWGGVFSYIPVGIWFTAPLFGGNIQWNPLIFFPLLMVFPLSIALAILRHRLWDLDIIINRTLVYGALTILLAGAYIGCVLLLETLFRSLTGWRSTISGALSTLLIVFLFNPLREKVQNFIDLRFFRRKYDITRTLSSFSAMIREEVNIDQLKANLIHVIADTMNPFQISLSNCLGDDADPPYKFQENDPLRTYLIESNDAIEVQRFKLVNSPILKKMKEDGIELLIPLINQKELVGMLALGPRKSEKDYTREDRRLLIMLADQAAPALRVAQLAQMQKAEALERERIEQEMRIARLVQHALLPKSLPEITGWRISVHYQPARAVGGDFYDFLPLPDGRMVVVIGDVTDKGVPAALIMATTRAVLRGAARRMLPPGEALERSNNLLYPEMLPNMFITCFYAILEPHTGRIQYANAGHNLPYHYQTDRVDELYATGMPLGLMEEMKYEQKESWIKPGDSLLFYSDGLVEAHNTHRDMFGVPRLKELIARYNNNHSIITDLMSEWGAFTGLEADQEDDITMVYLKRV
ncbi:MAG: SpoIIE family protein phosphatase [Anaerolineae bacterium]|nr:SpoIIE family protein phosphatase [Anaerolineae bacterium]